MVAHEDDVAEGVVDEGFEVPFLGAWRSALDFLGVLFSCTEGFELLLPTPEAGRTFTSTAASSGSSSRRCTSSGPLTAPSTEYPLCEKVAEPSARRRSEREA